MIVIELKDPLAVARQHSRLAGAVGTVSPKFVAAQVEQKLVAKLRRQLAAAGIEAVVSTDARRWAP